MDATVWLWVTFLLWFRSCTRTMGFLVCWALLGSPFHELYRLLGALIEVTNCFLR